MSTPAAPSAVILPASTAPSALPVWAQTLGHLLLPVAAILPYIWDGIMGAVNAGALQIPAAWAGIYTAAVIAFIAYQKATSAQQHSDAVNTLQDSIPQTGQPIPVPVLQHALYTEAKLSVPPLTMNVPNVSAGMPAV